MPDVYALAVDVETDGDSYRPNILEVGLRVVDVRLDTIAEKSWLIPHTAGNIRRMRELTDPVVRDMHDASGLWVECVASADGVFSPFDAAQFQFVSERRTIMKADIANWVAENATPAVLLGSSVHHDRAWLSQWIPGFSALLHHREIDVSSIKVEVEALAPHLTAGRPVPRKLHRVMPDLDDTLSELAFYRDVLGLTVAAS